ncbi:MAG: HD domain-containing protein [Pseudarcicella sp.]|nr:HD domain-containing protein [Pseudarcicella sp.]MBP6409468.1 HD domain-containing protein [Pseudarcicella sp.]
MNKKKIINDPIYGFINITSELIFDLIAHPYFQRLRRIKQLGIAEYVYPGAHHTRFHHALGAMHLMQEAISTLRSKGHLITDEEDEAAQIAILLHDIGHGPFSHLLESILLDGVHHEQLSLLIMQELNHCFDQKITLAIAMFEDKYERPFFHQLISSQLDVDRMDYLNRDSFFTGVKEGFIGADRIIKMINVVDNQLVVEEKGIYSVENFLTARRLMYWQVYLHKTAISAESMLIIVLKRAKELIQNGEIVYASDSLLNFLSNKINYQTFVGNKNYLKDFTSIDDNDIWYCVKNWVNHSDKILSSLSKMLLERKLFKILISDKPFDDETITKIKNELIENYKLSNQELSYFIHLGTTSNEAYVSGKKNINILSKNNKIQDIADASDLSNIKALTNIVKKYYVCWAKDVYL